ncbi:metal-dependent hydrolase, partial [Yersinia pestis]
SLLAVIAGIALFQVDAPLNGVLPPDVFHAMIIGYFSHLLADMITPAGVPLLWPCRWRFSIPLLRPQKGNQLERVLCVLLVCFSVYWQTDTTIPLLYYMEQLKSFRL